MMVLKNTLLLFSLFILFVFNMHAQRQIDRVAAVVGNEVILVSDIEAQYKLMASKAKGDVPENLRCVLFDQLLSNALLLTEADKDSITVNEIEVEGQLESRIQQIMSYMNNDPEQFRLYYGKTPEEVKNEMREDMRKQLLVQQMSQEVMQAVTITPKEVKGFFSQIPGDSLPYFNSEVEMAAIVIKPKVNPVEDEKAREKAENILEQLKEGEDFAELAKMYSQDPGSGAKGGDLGITTRGTFVTEFEAAAYQLDKDEISGIVKTEFGYHIIQLLERLGNNIHCRHILIKAEITEMDVATAKKEIDSIRTRILQDSLTFDQAIQRYSEDDFSKTRNGALLNQMTGEPYWELGDLDPEVYFAIEKLKEGEISNPIASKTPFGETEYRIIKIRNRTIPHVANLGDDYSRILSAAREEKRARFVSDWVSKKIDDHFVEIKVNALGEYAKYFFKENGQAKCEPLQRWMQQP